MMRASPASRHTFGGRTPLLVVQIVITSSFAKLHWQGDNEMTFLLSNQADTSAHLSTTRVGGFTLPCFIAKRQAGKL